MLKPGTRLLIAVVFFLSGAAGLGYQVIWGRWLQGVFGASSWAVAAVLAAFMAGLGLGSAVAGRRAATTRRSPLALYGMLEVGIGLYALVLPELLSGATWVQGTFAFRWIEHYYLYNGIRFLLCFAVVVVPTTLMGATLPLLAAFVGRRSDRPTRAVGLLYGLNTLGAVAGTLISGFLLLAWLGLRWSNALFVVVNLGVGAAAILHDRRLAGEPPPARPAATAKPRATAGAGPPAATPAHLLALVAPLFFVNGLFNIGYEVLWTRALSLVIGTTTYAFSLMLAVFLTGIALGSLWISRRLERLRNPLGTLLALQSFLSLWVLASPLLVGVLPDLYLEGLSLMGLTWTASIVLKIVLCTLLIFPLTLAMGAVFPLGIHLVSAGRARMAADVGDLYGLNTAGGIVGAILAGFVFIPLFGLARSLVVAALLHLAATALLAARSAPARKLLAARPLRWAAVATAALVLPFVARWDPRVLASGVYFQPSTFLDAQGGIHLREAMKQVVLRYHSEGVGATVDVLEAPGGFRALAIDGKSVATSNFYDYRVQRLLGVLPLLLHPDPRQILVIGLGTGMTAGTGALDPATESMRILEITKDVVGASEEFRTWNLDVLHKPTVRVIIEDASHYLRFVDQRFDVITSDPIHPFVAGAGNLYAEENYRIALGQLAPGGVFCQWVPLYQLARPDIDSILATFDSVFTNGTVWVTGKDFVLCGARDHYAIDFDALATKARQEPTAGVLRLLGFWHPEELLSAYVGELAALRPEFAAARINRVEHPILEFSAPRSIFRQTDAVNLERILGYANPAPPPFLTPPPPPTPAWETCMELQWRGFVADRMGDLATATRLARQAYDACPEVGFVRHFAAHTLLAGAAQVARTNRAAAARLLAQAKRLDPYTPEIDVRLREVGGGG